MSTCIDDGGPAFPNSNDVCGCYGMSLRDWFAGQALAGAIHIRASSPDDRFAFAAAAYAISNAMIAERAKEAAE